VLKGNFDEERIRVLLREELKAVGTSQPTSARSVGITEVTKGLFDAVLKESQIVVVNIQLADVATPPHPYTRYVWGAEIEGNQSVQYVNHIKAALRLDGRELDVTAITSHSIFSLASPHGGTIRGAPDAVIYARRRAAAHITAMEVLVRQSAIIYFELGKCDPSKGPVLGRKSIQACLEALCARLQGSELYCPILVVTDLQDEWTLVWAAASDKGSIEICVAPCSCAQALHYIDRILRRIRTLLAHDVVHLSSRDRRATPEPSDDDNDVLLSKRFKQLPKSDIANLGDISDMRTPNDIIYDFARQMYAQFPERFSSMYA